MFRFSEKRRSFGNQSITVGQVTVTDLNASPSFLSSDRLSLTSESGLPAARSSSLTNENAPAPLKAATGGGKTCDEVGGCLTPWFKRKRLPVPDAPPTRPDKRRSSEVFASLPKVMLGERRSSEIGHRPNTKPPQLQPSTILPDRQRITQSNSSPQLSIVSSKSLGFQGELRRLRDAPKGQLLNFNELHDKMPPAPTPVSPLPLQAAADGVDLSLRAELRRWKLKGCAKNVAFSLQARELSGMLAAAMVNYDEELLASFELLKRCVTSTFTKHFVNGSVLSSATEEDANELVKLVMSALQEEDGIGFCLGLRVTLRAFIDSLIDFDLDD